MASDMKDKRQQHFLFDLVAGGTSGMVSKCTQAPVERIKLLLQLQDANPHMARTQRYTGVWNCILRVYQEQGLLSFWRGNMAAVLRIFPSQAMNFAFKDKYRQTLVGNATKETNRTRFVLGSLAAGGLAGATALCATYPLDFARTRLAADVGKQDGRLREFTGIRDCISQVYARDGVRGLYQGFAPALFGVVIFRALFFGGYDVVKGLLNLDNPQSGTFERWVAAQVVTSVVGTACYPLDTVRRRMMMQAGRPPHERDYTGGIHCFRTIMQREGVRGFFKGLSANVLRGMSGSLLLISYDELQRLGAPK